MGKVSHINHGKDMDGDAVRVLITVSKITNISISDIRGTNRIHDIVEARRICMVLLHDELLYKSARVGRIFNRTHATALHAYRVHKDIYEVDKNYRRRYNICAAALGRQPDLDKTDDDCFMINKSKMAYLERENQELKAQIAEIKLILA